MKLSVLLQRFCSPFACFVVLFSLVLPNTAMPLSPSGEVVAVVQATTASGPGGNRTLSVEKPIYSGDTIKTGAAGNAQLRFLDDTRFVIGPKSDVVIDRYIFNPDKTLAGASITMARGAFRFMSGVGPKRAYKIKTPTATIGIRGTEVDVAVGRRLGTAVLVFQGAVQLCNRNSGQCRVVRSGCGAAIASPNGSVGSPRRAAEKAELIRSSFPLAQQQNNLPRDFRVNTGGCGLDAVPTTPERSQETQAQRASVASDPETRSEPTSVGRGDDGPADDGPADDRGHTPGNDGAFGNGGRDGGDGNDGNDDDAGHTGNDGDFGNDGNDDDAGHTAGNDGAFSGGGGNDGAGGGGNDGGGGDGR